MPKVYTLALVLCGSILFAFPASSAELIESYNAFLSSADHFNSSGERLTTAAAVIRQDRANFHKFGIRDPGDDDDHYFADADNRAILERMIRNGTSDPAALDQIVNSNVEIHVDVYRGDHGDFVIVSVLDGVSQTRIQRSPQ